MTKLRGKKSFTELQHHPGGATRSQQLVGQKNSAAGAGPASSRLGRSPVEPLTLALLTSASVPRTAVTLANWVNSPGSVSPASDF